MKKILVDLVIGIYLIGVIIGMIGIVTGFLTGESEMAGVGVATVLTSSLLLIALIMTLEVTESYLE